MRVAIVSSLDNGAGLERDYRLLAALFAERGHEVVGVHFRGAVPPETYDLVVYLEVFDEKFLKIGRRRWLVPNPEWWYQRWNGYLDSFARVLCKTRDAERIFRAHVGGAAIYTGFISEDRLDAAVPRERFFLHAAGASTAKGTAYILDAWSTIGTAHRLVVVGGAHVEGRPRGVEFLGRVEEAAYRRLQNAAWFHLCPSEYEGWGHYLHEAISVGAAVATTDAPPMNEFAGTAWRIPVAGHGRLQLARASVVSTAGVRAAVEGLAAMSDDALSQNAISARAAFLSARAAFLERFDQLLAEDGGTPPPVA